MVIKFFERVPFWETQTWEVPEHLLFLGQVTAPGQTAEDGLIPRPSPSVAAGGQLSPLSKPAGVKLSSGSGQGAGRRSDCLSNCIHRTREQTEHHSDPLGKACPGGSEQLTFVPSFPARPGSPCSPGGPGGPGWPRSPIGPVSPVGPCGKHRHQPPISGDSHRRGLLFLNLTTAARCQAHGLTFHETLVCL